MMLRPFTSVGLAVELAAKPVATHGVHLAVAFEFVEVAEQLAAPIGP